MAAEISKSDKNIYKRLERKNLRFLENSENLGTVFFKKIKKLGKWPNGDYYNFKVQEKKCPEGFIEFFQRLNGSVTLKRPK